VNVTHFVSFADGSGAEMLAEVNGFRFQATFVAGRVAVRPLSNVNFLTRTWGFLAALKSVEVEMAVRIAALGSAWLAAHRTMYGVAS